MQTPVSILCTGSEILDGRIDDSNSRFLIQALEELGVHAGQILACRDDIASIRKSIEFLLSHSRLLIISGGLGPTSDDVTREAVAEFAGHPLYLDAQALTDLKDLYQRRKRNFDSSNTKQAQFPQGSVVLKNPVGTAAGFRLDAGAGKQIFVVPGVPHELKRMFNDHIAPIIRHEFGTATAQPSRYLHVFGLPESKVGELVERNPVPPGISISYRAHYPEIIIKISSDDASAPVAEFTEHAKEAIGKDFIFSELPEQTFDQALHSLLSEKGKTIALAESCTGGLLGSLLTSNPGSSKYFLGGVIAYSNEIKSSQLHVPRDLIDSKGAVSVEVAECMAKGARDVFSSDLGVSITGIAGPEGGSTEKPVGTFFVGFASHDRTQAFHCFAAASRNMLRTFASFTALDIVRRYLLGYDLRPSGILGTLQFK
jgi:nicotinamide-nucleotide amidase